MLVPHSLRIPSSTFPIMATTLLSAAPQHDIFKLPLEVRLIIYSLLLVCDLPIPVYYVHYHHSHYSELILSLLPAGSTAILRVCWQIQREAENILYKSNKFYFSRPRNDLPRFLTSKSPRMYTSIKYLELRHPLGDR